MIRKALKILASALAGILLLTAALIVLIQTDWLRTILTSYLLEEMNSSIGGKIIVGDLGGNLYSSMELNHVAVTLEEDTIMTIPRIRLDYSLRGLLNRQVIVEHLVLESPRVKLVETHDSSWTIAKVFESSHLEGNENAGGFSWRVSVRKLEVSNARVEVLSNRLPKEVPRQVEHFMLQADALLDQGRFIANIVSMTADLRNPDLTIKGCEFTMAASDDSLVVRELDLSTPENSIRGSFVQAYHQEEMTIALDTAPLRFNELKGFGDLAGVNASPSVALHARRTPDSLLADIRLHERGSQIHLAGWMTMNEQVPRYYVLASFHKIDPVMLLDDVNFLSPLSGVVEVNGSGVRNDELVARMKLSLESIRAHGWKIDSCIVSSTVRADVVTGHIELGAEAGYLAASFQCINPLGSRQIAVDGRVEHLDISPVWTAGSDITMDFLATGTFPASGAAAAKLTMTGDTIAIGEFVTGKFFSTVNLGEEELFVDSLIMSFDGGALELRGRVDKELNAALKGRIVVDEWARISGLTGIQELSGSAEAEIAFWGDMARGKGEVLIGLRDTMYDSVHIGDLNIGIEGRFEPDSSLVVDFPRCLLNWNETPWLSQDTIKVRANGDRVAIEGVDLVSGSQRIQATADFGHESLRSISVKIRGLLLGPILRLVDQVIDAGTLDAEVSIQRIGSNPEARASVTLRDVQRGEFGPISSTVIASLKDSVVSYSLDVAGRQGQTLKSSGSIPVLPAYGDSSFLDLSRRLEVSVGTSHFNLATLGGFVPEGAVLLGTLDGQLGISGTAGTLRTEGKIRVDNGVFEFPRNGMFYNDISLQVVGSDEMFLIDELNVSTKGGKLTGDGQLRIEQVTGSWRINPVVHLRASRFEATSTANHSVIVSGDVNLAGTAAGVVQADGRLVIDRSRFYLPAFANSGTRQDQNPPLLVQAARRHDTLMVGQTIGDSAKRTLVPFIRGRVTIEIPRGTWLRGPRLNVELRGNLEVLKDSASFQIRGFLGIEQGTYEFYGKKFVMTEGRLDFGGGEKIDPTVYLVVEHSLKREETEDLLEIQVRGPASQATIEFFHNRDKISEGDAVSYILFGKKTSELSYGQKTTMADVGNLLAKDFAANLINSQLSSSVGTTLGLDVVKVSGEDNWNKATLTAGKYVTDDLYVAYERGITQSGSSNVLFESALLEYYIARFIYLRFVEATDKTSGVDLLLRFE